MTPYDNYRSISVERRGPILVLTLDRPLALNAVNAELHAELARIFVDVRRDPDARVVVLTGRACVLRRRRYRLDAGGDRRSRAVRGDRTGSKGDRVRPARSRQTAALPAQRARHRARRFARLLSDIIIAQENAKIGDPHVPVGLVAGDGGALIWPQLVGFAKARHYLFTGELMSAAEAERIGLVTKVVPESELDAAVYGLAERLAALPWQALQWTKVTINLPLKALFHAHFDAGVGYEMLSNVSADHREAVAAFREKRKPEFSGR